MFDLADLSQSERYCVQMVRAHGGEEAVARLQQRLLGVQDMILYKTSGFRDVCTYRSIIASHLGISPTRLSQLEQAYKKDGIIGLMDKFERGDKGKSRSLCLLAQRLVYEKSTVKKLSAPQILSELIHYRDTFPASLCACCIYNNSSLEYGAQEQQRSSESTPFPQCDLRKEGLVIPQSASTITRFLHSGQGHFRAYYSQNLSVVKPVGKAAAGSPVFDDDAKEYPVLINPKYLDREKYLIIEVKGDSMEPRLHDGDWVVAEIGLLPNQGQISLIHVASNDPNGEYLIKKFYKSAQSARLISLNKKYPPKVYKREELLDVYAVVHIGHL